MDARIARTKRTLFDALITLMEEKGFDRIRVADLTDRAGFNRGTFYLHYKDKDDLREQGEAELLQGLAACIQPLSPHRLSAHLAMTEPEPAMLDACRYLHEHANAFRVQLGPKGDPAFSARLKETLRQAVYERTLPLRAQQEQTLVPHDFLTAYLSSAQVGVLQHWLESGVKYSPHYMALLMTRMARLWASLAQTT